jgi:hypothetical protein
VATKRTPQNGHERLEAAMAMLVQDQAAFLGRLLEIERTTSERFARIEADMAAILRELVEHRRVLERLPDAVREKLGFKAP